MNVRKQPYRMLVALLVLAMTLGGVVSVMAQDDTGTTTEDATAYLGITFLQDEEQVIVDEVASGSPAEDAGLESGDVIATVDGEDVTSETIVTVIQGYAPGDTVALSVERGNETLAVDVTLGTRPDSRDMAIRVPGGRFAPDSPRDGFMFTRGRTQLGVALENTDDGVVIRNVVSGSPAEEAGLMVDDIIVSVNDSEITDRREIVEAIAGAAVGDTVTITVMRDGETLDFEIELAGPIVDMMELSGFPFSDTLTYNEVDGVWEVGELLPDGPLAEAGLQEGDVITAINGESYTPETLMEAIMPMMGQMDETAVLSVERDGETLEVEIPTALLFVMHMGDMRFHFDGEGRFGLPGRDFEFAPMPRDQQGFRFGFEQNRVVLGVAYLTLDADVAAENDVTLTEGALITEVLADTPAEAAGLQAGDVIVAVDGDVVDAERTLPDRLFAYEPGDTITLDVVREGEAIQIDVTLQNPRS